MTMEILETWKTATGESLNEKDMQTFHIYLKVIYQERFTVFTGRLGEVPRISRSIERLILHNQLPNHRVMDLPYTPCNYISSTQGIPLVPSANASSGLNEPPALQNTPQEDDIGLVSLSPENIRKYRKWEEKKRWQVIRSKYDSRCIGTWREPRQEIITKEEWEEQTSLSFARLHV